ncbi:MAG: hypothetical protein EOO70_01355 [Myxococcaceae bacterium]|nr:MAG: hypothetical protein EOO70_01355 [Myxococcaceae bacterium]
MALQRQVDMPRLVEALSDWNAVRLGALGPLEAEAARVLHETHAAFLSYMTAGTARGGVAWRECPGSTPAGRGWTRHALERHPQVPHLFEGALDLF